MNALANHYASAQRATAPGATELKWRRSFPGDERQLRALRRWLESLLPECATRDDVVAVAVEVATNAIKFTSSGQGGSFTVEITCQQRTVRVAIADGGAPAGPRLIDYPMSDHGRGLLMVRALSARCGVVGDERGRLVWADVAWIDEQTAARGALPDAYEAAIRADQTTLARRFPDAAIWFGRCTLQWWALPGWPAGRLLSAPSARELADLLGRMLGHGLMPQPRAAVMPGAARAGDQASPAEAPVPPLVHRTMPRIFRPETAPC